MKKLLLPILFAGFGIATAQAKLNCSFTEPFFTITFDPESKTIIRSEPNFESDTPPIKETVLSNEGRLVYIKTTKVDSIGVYGSVYELQTRPGKRLLRLTFNAKGSDGMSDQVYPYSAEIVNPNDATQVHHGGCDSTDIPATQYIYPEEKK